MIREKTRTVKVIKENETKVEDNTTQTHLEVISP